MNEADETIPGRIKRIGPKLWFLLAIPLVVLIGGATWLLWPKPLIEPSVKKKISFTILVPYSPYKVRAKSVVYDAQVKILTYVAQTNPGSPELQITEQAEPDLLTLGGQDIRNKFAATLGDYQDIDTAVGQVNLTKPNKVSNETAILIYQNSLIFVRSSQNLGTNDWQAFFNTMQVYK